MDDGPQRGLPNGLRALRRLCAPCGWVAHSSLVCMFGNVCRAHAKVSAPGPPPKKAEKSKADWVGPRSHISNPESQTPCKRKVERPAGLSCLGLARSRSSKSMAPSRHTSIALPGRCWASGWLSFHFITAKSQRAWWCPRRLSLRPPSRYRLAGHTIQYIPSFPPPTSPTANTGH